MKTTTQTTTKLPFPSCPNGGCGWYAISNLFNIDLRKVSKLGVEMGELSGVLYTLEQIYINTILASHKPLKPTYLIQLLDSAKTETKTPTYIPLIFNVKTKRGKHCITALKKQNSNLLLIIDPQKAHTSTTTPTQFFKKNEVLKVGIFMGGVGQMVSLDEEGVKHLLY